MRNLRLSISNIAWDISEDTKVATFLAEHGVDAIDIAPSKYFPLEMNPTDAEIKKVKDFWASYGIEIVGLQSLLFGATGLNIFDITTHKKLLNHLDRVARIAKALGAKFLVFGSPKNRDISGLSDDQVHTISKNFFRALGDIGLKYEVFFCIEPNPAVYNCNFVTHSAEAATLVKELNHPSVKMQLDTGTIVTNNEDFKKEIPSYKHLVGHMHLSTTGLKPISTDQDRLGSIIEVITANFANRLITIEMTTAPEVFESILFAKGKIQ